MKTKLTIEVATLEVKQLFRSYLSARHAYEATEATISALRSCFADVPQQLASLHASQRSEAQSLRSQIERLGYRVTVDAMNGYRPALATRSGCIVLS